MTAIYFMEGDTQSAVEGYEELRYGKFQTWMFETRSYMKRGLMVLAETRKHGKHIPKFSLKPELWIYGPP